MLLASIHRNLLPTWQNHSLFRQCLRALSSCAVSTENLEVVIVGTGIAGLSTAHYLLAKSTATPTSERPFRVRLIDICEEVAGGTSRKNGGLLCPSLSYAWTAFPLFRGENAVIPQVIQFSRNQGTRSSPISFDPKIFIDPRLWNFGLHWARRRGRLSTQDQHISAIMNYSMECFNDLKDDIIQSLDYNRFAQGTMTKDGKIALQDSSGDIGLFCKGLAEELVRRHEDRICFHFQESAHGFHIEEGEIKAVKTRDRDGRELLHAADKFVVAAGIRSYDICKEIGVPCPVFPVKGYIITFLSDISVPHNIELSGKAFVSPLGNGKYRLSGFAEFTSDYQHPDRAMKIDCQRIDALVDVAKEEFPDLKLVDADCGYRPISPDDTPMIGCTSKFLNLYLCTGHGSKGWTMGPGSGRLLADMMLGNITDIDPLPYDPKRFDHSFF